MIKKRGQVTIFVIAAILIVLAVVMFLLIKNKMVPGIGVQQEIEPRMFFSSCIETDLRNSLELISLQGGYIKNKLNRSFQFEGEKEPKDVSYLCYTQNNYLPCINQEPMIFNHLKKEIKEDISQEVKKCFDDLASELEKRGYTVNANYNGFDVKLISKRVSIDVDAVIVLTKTGETKRIEGFEVVIPSRFYDIVEVVQEIVSQEARFCNFEQLGYMMLNTQFDIDKFRTGDSDTIYRVSHRDSKEKFVFAVRGCVLPPGF